MSTRISYRSLKLSVYNLSKLHTLVVQTVDKEGEWAKSNDQLQDCLSDRKVLVLSGGAAGLGAVLGSCAGVFPFSSN